MLMCAQCQCVLTLVDRANPPGSVFVVVVVVVARRCVSRLCAASSAGGSRPRNSTNRAQYVSAGRDDEIKSSKVAP